MCVQFLPSVTELVVAQCYYLDFDDRNRSKPIYVYLNSTGCINEKGQAVSADNEFYAIWAALGFTRAPLYTGERSLWKQLRVLLLARGCCRCSCGVPGTVCLAYVCAAGCCDGDVLPQRLLHWWVTTSGKSAG